MRPRCEEPRALRRQLEAAVPPDEQRAPQRVLERVDLAAEGGLGDGQLAGGGGDVQRPRHGDEAAEQLERREVQEAGWHSRSAWKPARDGIGAAPGSSVRKRPMDPSIAQFTKGERPRPGSVIASLLYLGRCPDVPFSYVGRPPRGCPPTARLHRPAGGHPRCQRHRRLPRPRPERVRAVACPVLGDFVDEEEVESRNVPELVELVLRATAGESAHVSTPSSADASSAGRR